MVSQTPHPTEALLASYLDGMLSGDERGAVEAHLERCTECRASLAGVARIVDETPAVSPRRTHRRRWPVAGGLAAAAVLSFVLLYAPSRPGSDVERAAPASEDLRQVDVVQPESDASISADDAVLAWRASAARSYAVFVMDNQGALIWSTQTPDTQVLIPASLLRGDHVYLFYVDAIADGVIATSGVHRFRTTP